VGVVTHRLGEHPPCVHAGQVQGPRELALQGRPAVRDRVALEESRFVLGLVPGLAYRDRRAQQRGRLRRRDATQRVLRPGRGEIPVDCRRTHRQQLRAHLDRVSSVPEGQLPVPFQAVQLQPHRGGQVLPTLTTRGSPDLLKHDGCVVGVLPRTPLPGDLHRPRTRLRRRREPTPRVVPRPARHRDHLVKQPALVLLRNLRIRLGVLRRDLKPCAHRQLTSHAPRLTISRALLREAPKAFRGHFR